MVLDVGMYILFKYAKPDYTAIPEIGPHQFEQYPYKDYYGWEPNEEIYEALADRDMKLVIPYLVKPLLIAVVMAPISETVIFFGMLFPVVWRRYSYRRAIWVTPLIFMLIHFEPSDFDVTYYPFYFLSGVILTWPYAKTRSLYPSIILHGCWNTSCYVMLTIFNWGLPPPLK